MIFYPKSTELSQVFPLKTLFLQVQLNKVYLSNIQFTKIFIFGQVVARFCLWREESIQNILKNNALHKSVNIKKTSYYK